MIGKSFQKIKKPLRWGEAFAVFFFSLSGLQGRRVLHDLAAASMPFLREAKSHHGPG